MRKNISTARIIAYLLVWMTFFPSVMAVSKFKQNPCVMENGVICSIDPLSSTATLVGVTEFSGNSFPESVTYEDARCRITNIAPYCLWPAAAISPDSITLPGSIRKIGDHAFAGFPRLRHVNLPDSLEHIGQWAFAYTALERVRLPKSLNTISQGAFEGCVHLSEVNLENIKYIERAAFKDCAIRIVLINDDDMLIGKDAFAGCNVVFLGLILDNLYIPEYALFAPKDQFGTNNIPWIEAYGISPYLLYRDYPKSMEGRTCVDKDNKTDLPLYISFEEAGGLETEWDSHDYLWPMTDTLRTASRDDYVAFMTPAKIRIDTSVLPKEVRDTVKLQVFYNGEDITLKMRNDTIFLTEGYRFNPPKDFNKFSHPPKNGLEIRYRR